MGGNDLMELALITTVLTDPVYGWVGWVMILTIVIVVAIGIISKWALTAVENVKAIREKMSKKTDYRKQIKTEADINQILRTIKHDLHADSVVIMQYHNGVHSLADNSLLRISATHESVVANVSSHLKDMDGLMASFLGEINNSIFEGRYVDVRNLAELDDDVTARGFRQYLDSIRAKSVYLFPLADAYGKTFGIGVVMYVTKEHDISPEFMKWASGRFHAIGALLAGTGMEGK
jgi:hypothetical protein